MQGTKKSTRRQTYYQKFSREKESIETKIRSRNLSRFLSPRRNIDGSMFVLEPIETWTRTTTTGEEILFLLPETSIEHRSFDIAVNAPFISTYRGTY